VWKVCCGYRHTALITTTGLLLTFGHGETGRLGHGNEDSLDAPRVVEFFAEQDEAIISVGCGREHTMAATAAGELYSWGWGEAGRLGIGETGVMASPQRVEELDRLEVRALAVACGREHSLIICEGGGLLACGAGYEGRLGLGNQDDALVPRRVSSGALDHDNVVLAAAGEMHSVALGESGQVYTWGFGGSGARRPRGVRHAGAAADGERAADGLRGGGGGRGRGLRHIPHHGAQRAREPVRVRRRAERPAG
ncbi:unnamed protein product, partial [Heterosigma akashiwo]